MVSRCASRRSPPSSQFGLLCTGSNAAIGGTMDTGVNDEAKRPRFCDVVMKGGITSGVVYPKAVVTLAKAFGLKNIGGTSAGAIAAAAAAAAEFAKRKGSATGGY